MQHSLFSPVTGIIQSVSLDSENCCQQMITLIGIDGITNFLVTGSTYVADCAPLVPGMQVTAFYDTSLPVPLIYPPRYQAAAISPISNGVTVVLDYFNENLMNTDQTLKLNVSEYTQIITSNGQPVQCIPLNHYLMVYYSITTASIPAQTTPQKIIIMC